MSEQETGRITIHDRLKKTDAMRIILIIVVVALGVVYVLFSSIQKPGTRGQADMNVVSVPTDATPRDLVEGAPDAGLARLPEKAAPTPEKTPATIEQPVPSAPALAAPVIPESIRQEREQLRKFRFQQNLAALNAPLEAQLSASHSKAEKPVLNIQNSNDPVRSQPDLQALGAMGSQTESQDRQDKEAFLNDRSRAGTEWQLPHTRVAGAYCEIKTGTVIPAIMLTGINSDLPGSIIGQVSQNVYDTATGTMLVIPQGSRLFGKYDSRIAVGQARVLIAWNRIIFPDGSSVSLESMPGADQAGMGGFEDEVDNHYLRIFGSAAVMSMITGGMSYAVDSFGNGSTDSNENPSMRDQMGTALASQMGQASMQLLQQNVNIKPTLGIRSGYRFNLVVVKDIAFDAPYTPAR